MCGHENAFFQIVECVSPSNSPLETQLASMQLIVLRGYTNYKAILPNHCQKLPLSNSETLSLGFPSIES